MLTNIFRLCVVRKGASYSCSITICFFFFRVFFDHFVTAAVATLNKKQRKEADKNLLLCDFFIAVNFNKSQRISLYLITVFSELNIQFSLSEYRMFIVRTCLSLCFFLFIILFRMTFNTYHISRVCRAKRKINEMNDGVNKELEDQHMLVTRLNYNNLSSFFLFFFSLWCVTSGTSSMRMKFLKVVHRNSSISNQKL